MKQYLTSAYRFFSLTYNSMSSVRTNLRECHRVQHWKYLRDNFLRQSVEGLVMMGKSTTWGVSRFISLGWYSFDGVDNSRVSNKVHWLYQNTYQRGRVLDWLHNCSNQTALSATIALVPLLTHWLVIYVRIQRSGIAHHQLIATQLETNERHQFESCYRASNQPLNHDFDPNCLDTEDINKFTTH